jgi:hypothetical protein
MGYKCFSQPSFQEISLLSSLRELLHECGSEAQVVDFFCTSWVANVLHATFISREITIITITEGALHECGSEAKFCILVLHATFISRDITIIIITEGALHECGLEAKFCILVLSVVHNLHFKRDCYHYHCRNVHWRQLRVKIWHTRFDKRLHSVYSPKLQTYTTHLDCIVLSLPSFSSGILKNILLQHSTV